MAAMSAPTLTTLRRIAGDEPVSLALAATLLALAVSPKNGAALTGLLAICVFAAALGLLRGVTRDDGRMPLVFLVPGFALVVSAVFAVNPVVSLAGVVTQRAGAVAWIAAGALGLVLALTARPGDAGRTARAAAVFCGLLGVAVVVEAIGLMSVARAPGPRAGLMENSLSAGQLLVVGLFCAFAWFSATRDVRQRTIAAASGIACLVGIVLVDSAGAWLGLAVGVAACVGTWLLARRDKLCPRGLSHVAGGLFAAASGALWLVFGLLGPSGIEQRLSEAANGRFEIWRTAAAAFERAPWIGAGPEQFSAYIAWDSVPGQTFEAVGTYDPHNLQLYLMAGGGLLAIAAFTAFLVVAVRAMLAPLRERASWPIAALVGAVAGWLATVMLVWVSPLALGVVFALIAPFMGVAGRGPKVGRVGTLVTIAAAVAAGVATYVFATGAPAEYRWTRAMDDSAITSDLALEIADGAHDPAYAIAATQRVLAETYSGQSSVPDALDRLEPVVETLSRDAVWQVDAAFVRYQIEALRLSAVEDGSWAPVAAALDAGRLSDPLTGLWDYNGAVQAENLGFDPEALEYATAALRYELPDEVRAHLEARIAELEAQ